MNSVKFTIDGEPTGKGRARVFHNNGITRAVTPEKTVNYENLVKLMFKQTQFKPSDEAYRGEIHIRVRCYYSIPKSATKGKRASMLAIDIRPMKKPDADNVLKCVADALNGIAYHDDSQITEACIEKYYGDRPSVEVFIKYLSEVTL